MGEGEESLYMSACSICKTNKQILIFDAGDPLKVVGD